MNTLTNFLFFLVLTFNLFAQEGLVKSYYDDGKIKSEINYMNNIRDGLARFYWANGNAEEELNYVNGRVEGLVKTYYENGSLKEMYYLENGRRDGYSNTYDEQGNLLSERIFSGGKLVLPETDENPYPLTEPKTDLASKHESALNSQSAEKLSNDTGIPLLPPNNIDENIEDDPAYYYSAEIMPEPVRGFKSIQDKIYYPELAKQDKVEGVVKIRTFIDQYGEVTRTELVEGIGYGCDESAEIAVYYTKFKPGIIRGKPVRVQMIIPVEFKLEN